MAQWNAGGIERLKPHLISRILPNSTSLNYERTIYYNGIMLNMIFIQ